MAIFRRKEAERCHPHPLGCHYDPYPKEKRKDLSLREKEKQIEQDIFNKIISNGGNYTVLTLVEKYVSLKTGVRHNT